MRAPARGASVRGVHRIARLAVIVVLLAPVAAAGSRGSTSRSRGAQTRRERATPRLRLQTDVPASAAECDTPRGVRAFGSTDRCLRALCVDHNHTNAYDLDAAQRLRRNPCAEMDPFELRR